MILELYDHQKEVIDKMHNGCILYGQYGSGKSLASIEYFYTKECLGTRGEPPRLSKDLYIITTAKKRDDADWIKECGLYFLTSDRNSSLGGIQVKIDSWNNIKKYEKIKDAFFIFDEQRVVGSGTWVDAFLKITKYNNWVLLSATPGDTWTDYVPVFLANGFYGSRTEFNREHVIFKPFLTYPVVDRYINEGRLLKLKKRILVEMPDTRPTISHFQEVDVSYNKSKYFECVKTRWNPFREEPISTAGGFVYTLRHILNEDVSRLARLMEIYRNHGRVIIFYNFDYELKLLRDYLKFCEVDFSEWNGHLHQSIPDTEKWCYLVQYAAGAEGWNCITCDTMVFYSLNYSYKTMTQAKGRINRMNTQYRDLYYYELISDAPIDRRIKECLVEKKNFNDKQYVEQELNYGN